jgi:uroporphyrinogen-III synthase
MAPAILITRPDPSGAAFADQVRARLGCKPEIVLSPIMRIEHCGDLPEMSGYGTLIFTSRHGVEAYLARHGRRDIPAYAVGNATAAAARKAGIDVISCDGDAGDLIARILADSPPAPCLHLRGEHIAANIAQALTLAGTETHEAVIYRQTQGQLTARALSLLQGGTPVIVPLFSPRSAELFFEQAAGAAPMLVAAISDNVRDAVPRGAAQRIETAEKPTAQAMLEVIVTLWNSAKRLEGGNPAK